MKSLGMAILLSCTIASWKHPFHIIQGPTVPIVNCRSVYFNNQLLFLNVSQLSKYLEVKPKLNSLRIFYVGTSEPKTQLKQLFFFSAINVWYLKFSHEQSIDRKEYQKMVIRGVNFYYIIHKIQIHWYCRHKLFQHPQFHSLKWPNKSPGLFQLLENF